MFLGESPGKRGGVQVKLVSSYDEVLDYLNRFTDYEKQARFGQGYKKFSLDPVRSLLASCGDPHLRQSVLHVAGTKGKGSTCLMLTEILEKHGLKVGIYTSPHLEDLRERIRTGGVDIAPDEFAAVFSEILPHLEEVRKGPIDLVPTFFDLLTVIGFLAFSRASVDATVLETGLGGRLDSTNVVDPFVTVLTNVGLDHVETLGHDLESIAREKAGIMKPNVPLVSGINADSPGFDVVCGRAEELSCPVFSLGREILLEEEEGEQPVTFSVRTPTGVYLDLALSVPGRKQRENAALAVGAAELFLLAKGLRLAEDKLRGALRSVKLPGRTEFVSENPSVLLDGAHNPDSALALADVLQSEIKWTGGITLLFAMNQRACPGEVLDPLLPLVAQVVVTRVASPRSECPEVIARYVRERGVEAFVVPDAASALPRALELAGKAGRVVVTGSFWFVGEVRGWFGREPW